MLRRSSLLQLSSIVLLWRSPDCTCLTGEEYLQRHLQEDSESSSGGGEAAGMKPFGLSCKNKHVTKLLGVVVQESTGGEDGKFSASCENLTEESTLKVETSVSGLVPR